MKLQVALVCFHLVFLYSKFARSALCTANRAPLDLSWITFLIMPEHLSVCLVITWKEGMIALQAYNFLISFLFFRLNPWFKFCFCFLFFPFFLFLILLFVLIFLFDFRLLRSRFTLFVLSALLFMFSCSAFVFYLLFCLSCSCLFKMWVYCFCMGFHCWSHSQF